MDSPFDLQIICSTPGDVARAQRGGATRIELSAGYTAGGMTPSPGTIQSCIAATDLPVLVAMRPREGHLVYSSSEREIILNDAAYSLDKGASGVLIGGLTGHLEFDFDLIETAIDRFGGDKVMVNRALDSAKRTLRDFERLTSLPIAALASSAGLGNAIKGHQQLVDWQSEVDFDIYASGAVLPGGAGRMWSAGLSCFRASARKSGGVAHEGRWFEGEIYPVDAQRVAQLVKAIQRAIAQEEEETDAPSSESEQP